MTRLNRVKLVKTDSVSNLSSSHPPVSLNLKTGRKCLKSVADVVIKSSEAEVEMAEQQERHRALWVV